MLFCYFGLLCFGLCYFDVLSIFNYVKRIYVVSIEFSVIIEKESEFLLMLLLMVNVMSVIKCNGIIELVDLNKIVCVVQCFFEGLYVVDLMCVVICIIFGLYNGVIICELDELFICIVVLLIGEEFEYGCFVVCLLVNYIVKEVLGQEIYVFLQLVSRGYEVGLINDCLLNFVQINVCKFNDVIDGVLDLNFDYFGLCILYDCYLLCYLYICKVIEILQQFFLCIVSVLSEDVFEILVLYKCMGNLDYLLFSLILFNFGIIYEQLFLCFLLDLLQDLLELIYVKYGDIVQLLKFFGGIGVSYICVCLCGLLIKLINGYFNGIVLWLKIMDLFVVVVNQGGKCKGVVCVYLEIWYVDIEDFFELCDNIGDEVCCVYNLNLVNWVLDLFMKCVEVDQEWLLFDLCVVLEFIDLFGEVFEVVYLQVEVQGKVNCIIFVCKLYVCMMCMLVEIGNGWMIFKDKCNCVSNQILCLGNVIYLFNLCIEILEVIFNDEIVVCNLGLINLGNYFDEYNEFDFEKLVEIVCLVVCQFDCVIDLNFYLIEIVCCVNLCWCLVGLGCMGLQDVFFCKCLLFDSVEVCVLLKKIVEVIYFYVLEMFCELVQECGKYLLFNDICVVSGELQFDVWNVVLEDIVCWDVLCECIKEYGLCNLLMIVIVLIVIIVLIVGCYECVELQVFNLFKCEILFGDFLQVNCYLVNELKKLGLWMLEMCDVIKLVEGFIVGLLQILEMLCEVYCIVWELLMCLLIDMVVECGVFIDQLVLFNLFMESLNIGVMFFMYMYVWKQGIKIIYYLCLCLVIKIVKIMVSVVVLVKVFSLDEVIVCLLENLEVCEVCQ